MTRRKGRGLSSNPCSSLQDGLFGGLGCRVVRRACRLLCRGGSLPGCLLELLHPLLGHLLEVLHSLPRGRLSSIHGLLEESQRGEEEISVRLHRLLGQRLESLLLVLILLSQLLYECTTALSVAPQHLDAVLKHTLGKCQVALLGCDNCICKSLAGLLNGPKHLFGGLTGLHVCHDLLSFLVPPAIVHRDDACSTKASICILHLYAKIVKGTMRAWYHTIVTMFEEGPSFHLALSYWDDGVWFL